MTKTENFSLPQWEASDPVRREDFNDAMAKLDSLYVVGSYAGDGLSMADGGQLINLGFKPRFVIISRSWTGNTSTSFLAVGPVRVVGLVDMFTFETNGFRVATGEGSSGSLNLNNSSYNYGYIAFR